MAQIQPTIRIRRRSIKRKKKFNPSPLEQSLIKALIKGLIAMAEIMSKKDGSSIEENIAKLAKDRMIPNVSGR